MGKSGPTVNQLVFIQTIKKTCCNILIMPKKVEKRGAHLRVPDHLKVAKKEYVPTGRPRGRLPGEGVKPDHLKKPKKLPSGKPRGRPKKTVE